MPNAKSKDGEIDPVRHRFEWDAKSFDAIYRLERSPWSRWFNKTFRAAIFERYTITFAQAGDLHGKRVLDIGCGSGVYSVDFAKRGATRVLGVDFSESMLALARRQAEEHGAQDTCEFRSANFMDAKIDETFDVAIAMGVFDYLKDPEPFLRKMVELTSGKVIVSLPGHSLIREPARRLRYKLTGRGDVHFYSESDVRQIARAAGLVDAEIIPIGGSATGTGFVLVGSGTATKAT